jgi:hypothetical protein
MSLTAIDQLPDSSRVWCFGTDRPLSPQEATRLRTAVERFLESWAAHGVPLRTAMDWRRERFLVVAVDESAAGASGCSIDALSRRLAELENELGVELRDGSPVWYLEGGEGGTVRRVSRQLFRDLAAAGEIDEGTIVFDLTAERLGDLRAGHLERPAGKSWHARLLAGPRPTPAGAPGAGS